MLAVFILLVSSIFHRSAWALHSCRCCCSSRYFNTVVSSPTIAGTTTSNRRVVHRPAVPSFQPHTLLLSLQSSSSSQPDENETEGRRRLAAEQQRSTKQHDKTTSSSTTTPLPTASDFPSWAYDARPFFHFEIIAESSKSGARVGRIHTPHGIVDTPAFVAVATNGALKGVDFRDADEAGQQLVFCNTYHLLLQPGPDVIREAGGLHRFTHREEGGGPFITDSGGFQVFSLAYGSVHDEITSKQELKKSTNRRRRHSNNNNNNNLVQITEHGARFRSYRDGSQFLLTPENTIQAQKAFQADIILPLDELPPYHIDDIRLRHSVERSHRWEARSLQEHIRNIQNQAMYAIIHGGVNRRLRRESVDYLTSLPFDGYAIGGSLGSSRMEMKDLLKDVVPLLHHPQRRNAKPRHLLGIADEESIRHAVSLGIDSMDSCYPTRLGRHGTLLTKQGNIYLKRGKYARSFGVKIDEGCGCKTCRGYDRAYLCHLFKANEPLAVALATLHNIQYTNDLMAELRNDIREGKI